ncbi:uncharacterized protein LOC111788300 [Cucurbita pepo subsp. pepo]|uniref:uncharacterized protein LOC111788300 n=1 Tax=Cucurbita pepo subsp. pepo TaxID=3664 RepID=UPI000C9D7CF1|nr:uncharacterized protein LOC111788300 [Cucurbita pepo subsp. pepo]
MAQESLSSNGSPDCSPRKARNGLKPHSKDKKNPYSDRGLDKFSALLTDLEEKRKRIYAQTDPENIVLVRFAYKNSDECVPVVVKQKDKKEEKRVNDIKPAITQKQPDKKSLVRVRTLRKLRKPGYYVTAMVILILVLLCVFGRSVAIMCTCVAWYLVPVLKQSWSRSRTSMKRKEYARILTRNNKCEQPI